MRVWIIKLQLNNHTLVILANSLSYPAYKYLHQLPGTEGKNSFFPFIPQLLHVQKYKLLQHKQKTRLQISSRFTPEMREGIIWFVLEQQKLLQCCLAGDRVNQLQHIVRSWIFLTRWTDCLTTRYNLSLSFLVLLWEYLMLSRSAENYPFFISRAAVYVTMLIICW